MSATMAGRISGERRTIVSVNVDATSYEKACHDVSAWALRGEPRYVCVCNVHMVMEAYDDPAFREVVNGADLVTPDGMPLVWALRAMGIDDASRVYGPDLMLALCRTAENEGIPIGLYGGAQDVLETLRSELRRQFPRLLIPYAHSPSFAETRDATAEIEKIRAADVRLLFVALGCPRQERWMALHNGKVPGVMVGVGAAFDFLSGTKWQAPRLFQKAGLEWAFRFASEPRRLWRRYAVHNPRFLALLALQLVGRRFTSNRTRARSR